jgi:hypothetical protein
VANEKEELIPSDGEIMIYTSPELGEDFIETFVKKIGYEYSGVWEFGHDAYIIKVPYGDEDYLIQSIPEKYSEFIPSASRRYPLIDKRFEFTNCLEDKVRELNDYVEEQEFIKRLEEIKKEIEDFKD